MVMVSCRLRLVLVLVVWCCFSKFVVSCLNVCNGCIWNNWCNLFLISSRIVVSVCGNVVICMKSGKLNEWCGF